VRIQTGIVVLIAAFGLSALPVLAANENANEHAVDAAPNENANENAFDPRPDEHANEHALDPGPTVDPAPNEHANENAFDPRPDEHANEHALDHSSKQAAGGPDNHGNGSNGGGSKARAYGKLCQDQSKEHVKGEKGTPFSQCVRAMARVDRGSEDSPRKACEGLSREHVKGERGTPFSRCVKAAAQLQND
jgi:hypothetical protein